ncbi:MAG: ABC transporter permease [Cyclobacteriaceae bacterium]
MIKDFEYIIEPTRKKVFDLKELWQYRELFYFFTWRDVKVKYKETVLGIIWVILQPILSVGIFSIFFGRGLNVPSAGLPYPVFVFSGLLLWTVFSASISNGGNSMVTNAPIIKKIYFPRIIIPISSILVSAIDFIIAFAVFIAMLMYYNVVVDFPGVLYFWPAAIVLMILGTLGISCWLAALNVKYRDFRFVIPFGLQIALFVTPVIYPISILGETSLTYVLAINPMYGAIMLFRAPFGLVVSKPELLISLFSSFILLLWGVYYFKKTEAYFADIA